MSKRERDEKGKEGEEIIKTKWDRDEETGTFQINKIKHIWLQESKQ